MSVISLTAGRPGQKAAVDHATFSGNHSERFFVAQS